MHGDLLTTCSKTLRKDGTGVIYLTFQHHNEHAPAFFVLAKERGFTVTKLATIGWGGRDVDVRASFGLLTRDFEVLVI